jgi:flagellar biosynthetic protein FliP
MKRLKKISLVAVLIVVIAGLTAGRAGAAGSVEDLTRTLFGENTETIDIIILLTLLTLLPSIVIMLTGFTRIIIVLSFVRNALGMQQMPPNQVLIGLALFLTMFVMGPVLKDVYDNAYVPYTRRRSRKTSSLSAQWNPQETLCSGKPEKRIYPFLLRCPRKRSRHLRKLPTEF